VEEKWPIYYDWAQRTIIHFHAIRKFFEACHSVASKMPYLYLLHCTENPIYVFSEMKLRGLVPNSYIHVSVRDFYIPGSVCLIACSMQRELGDRTLKFCFGNKKATQFNFWQYINRNQTFYWILTGPSFAV
jgi:hypothetical protein